MAEPWDGFIPAETLEHYRRAGFAAPSRMGERPALLVIDVQYMTTGEGPVPLSEGLDYHPMNCGEAAWTAIGHMAGLLKVFRERGFPVLYPYVSPKRRRAKHARMPVSVQPLPRHWEIVEEVAPLPGDILVPKTSASAFFGTPLMAHLTALRVDTLFCVGNTTSGCVRASVTDAYSMNFKVVVPHECSYDRSPVSHAVNLFDIASKYAEVVSTEAAINMVCQMPGGVSPEY